jgi:hypothetical protein
MHYKTVKCDWPLNTIDDFVVDKKDVKKLNLSEIEFKAGKLPEATEIVILQPAS